MSVISVPQLTDGTTHTAADHNNAVNTIANDYNGNIDNTNVKAGAAIDFGKISGGSSTALGAFQTWTPTMTTFTLGNGTLACRYQQIGKTVTCKFLWTLGTTSSVGTGIPTLTLPVAAHASYATAATNTPVGSAALNRSSVGYFNLFFAFVASSTVVSVFRTSGDPQQLTAVSASLPAAWASTDVMAGSFEYEAA